MVFKLVRIDTPEPSKIQLSIGTHIIGRGKFLHDDAKDKRVSRNHAELEVTADTITLKSLHQNPCFYIKKHTEETQLLLQDCTECLCHGDKFGLIPDHFWYEVLHCADEIITENTAAVTRRKENGICNDNDEEDQVMNEIREREQNNVTPDINPAAEAENEEEPINFNEIEEPPINFKEIDDQPINFEENDDIPLRFDENEEVGDAVRSASPSVITTAEETTKDHEEPAMPAEPAIPTEPAMPTELAIPAVPEELTVRYSWSPPKRSHSPRESSPVDVKKVKAESDADRDEAGPSNQQQASSDTDTKDNIVQPASQAKPNIGLKERCIYGANCYRRNPAHLSQYSHPGDAWWGGGARGRCPWGRACRRRDPRHWTQHDHPLGTQQPPAHRTPGKRPKRRRRNDTYSDDEDDSPIDVLIVTGKRARKTVQRQDWSALESEGEEDPYGTDESDEWQPPSDATTSQDYTQD